MDDGRRRYADLPRSASRIAKDVDAEILFDLEMRVSELVAEGMSEGAARERAVREFGDLEATRRYCAAVDEQLDRRARWSQWADELVNDCVLTWRAMRRMRGFAAVVLLTLAAGIGANTAIFSVVRRILIDRLPYRSASELVRIYAGKPGPAGSGFFTPLELRDLATMPSLAGVAAFGNVGSTTYYGEASAEVLPGAAITPNFFTVLGASPVLGRTFGAADIAPNATAVAMISYDAWHRVFDDDPHIVGRVIRLVGGSRTIVGVMRRDFVSPMFMADIWTPLNVQSMLGTPAATRNRGFRAIARLRPAMSVERVTTDAATLAARWRADGFIPATLPSPHAVSLRDAMVGDARPALLAVMAAAILVLVITCTNIAGLFLARASSRRRELAVRIALGASRARLIRQLLTEALVYGLVGGVLGIVLAWGTQPVLVRLANEALPNLGEIRFDLGLMLTAILASVACGIAFGVMPAITASRVDLKASMSDAGRAASAGEDRVRVRQLLVGSQIALAALLMIGAGLLLRSFDGLIGTNLGYSTDKDVLIFSIYTPRLRQPDQSARNAFLSDAVGRVRALPGVTNVGLTAIGPWNGPNGTTLRTPGVETADDAGVNALYLTATDGYFEAMGTRIVRGRSIAATDRVGAPPVAVISESAARRLFGSDDPIGKQVLVDAGNPRADQGHEVVGVAADVRETVTSDINPAVYVSDWQANKEGWSQFIVRTNGDAGRLVPTLRQLVHEINPLSPLLFPRTMSDILHMRLAPQQLSLVLFGLFAVLALTLAALGVYGVMSYVVSTRTREFGIRAALGARRGTLLRLVLRQGMRYAIAGSIAGLVVAFVGARVIAKLLVGVSVRDPLTFVTAPAILLIVTLVACAIPAWRATRVDPVDALRAD